MSNIQKKYDIKNPKRNGMPDHYGKNRSGDGDECTTEMLGHSS